MSATCPTVCVEQNHPGREHGQWRRLCESPTTQLHDDVWCLTCSYTHIPSIPTVTYACQSCGFGAWEDLVAEDHAALYPDHIVYGSHHRTIPVSEHLRSLNKSRP